MMKTKKNEITAVNESSFGVWKETDVSGTLRSYGGLIGVERSTCDLSHGRTVIGIIADHPTHKWNVGDEAAYTLNSRDYKGVMVVVISE